tara:strand:- start:8791 stop:9150 length:360 start_codon:yes stop_codon:yes gene_type:complete
VSVTKLGKYGHVKWVHQLVCGHTVIRKRKSPTGVLGCVKCIDAEKFEEMSQSLTTMIDSPYDDGLSDAELKASKLKAILAGRFDVPSEQVDVVIRSNVAGEMIVDSATISLTRRQLHNL